MAAEITVAALAGGFVGLLAIAILDQRGQNTDTEYSIAVVAGALLAVGLHRLLR